MKPDRALLRPIAGVAAIAIAATVAPWFVQVDPNHVDLSHRLSAPGTSAWFGTDELGRDVFSRNTHGLALSLGLSLLVTVTATAAGIAVGATAGWFYQTWIDKTFNWIASALSAVPFLLVMAAALSLLEPSLVNAYIVLAGLLWVGPARLCRGRCARRNRRGYAPPVRNREASYGSLRRARSRAIFSRARGATATSQPRAHGVRRTQPSGLELGILVR